MMKDIPAVISMRCVKDILKRSPNDPYWMAVAIAGGLSFGEAREALHANRVSPQEVFDRCVALRQAIDTEVRKYGPEHTGKIPAGIESWRSWLPVLNDVIARAQTLAGPSSLAHIAAKGLSACQRRDENPAAERAVRFREVVVERDSAHEAVRTVEKLYYDGDAAPDMPTPRRNLAPVTKVTTYKYDSNNNLVATEERDAA